MAQVIFRTAFFQIIREAEDLGAGLYTADGQEIAESETTAMHCGSIGAYLKGILRVWGDDIVEGDAFMHNDPHNGASHLADICIAVPIFWEGELVAWAADTAHLADLGARPRRACARTRSTPSPRAATTSALKFEVGGARNAELIRHVFETSARRTSTAATSRRSTRLAARRRGFRALLEKYGRDM